MYIDGPWVDLGLSCTLCHFLLTTTLLMKHQNEEIPRRTNEMGSNLAPSCPDWQLAEPVWTLCYVVHEEMKGEKITVLVSDVSPT